VLTERATEIFNSLSVINVNYNDKPVWIEDVKRENNKVQVKDLNTNEVIEVEVSDLVEK
jgi:H-type small acid-soluble spore protein